MMECNKEEAIRAKEIAETKMQNKDFSGARKVALKAQQLYPELENISQLLIVCDVHLSAESKSYGNENNWYEILKIESTADDISIKKQYRKFALLLHPDKNKFAGATDAFKLIVEAQRVLLDREKRSLFDSKTKNWRLNRGPQQQGSNNPYNRTQPWGQNPFMGKTTSPFTSFNPQQQQQQPPKPPQSTFWTMCPYCTFKYQYYRDVVNKVLWCQGCKKSFNGLEIKNQATSSHTPWTQPNSSFKPQPREPVAKTVASEVGRGSRAKSKSSEKVNVKRKKRIDESSESCDSGSSSESEEDVVIEENGDVKVKQDFGCSGENLRRSTRSKTNISYKENLSADDDLGSSSKKAKSSGSFRANECPGLEKKASQANKFRGSSKPIEENDSIKVEPKGTEIGNGGLVKNGGKRSVNANSGISPDSSPDKASVPEIYDYPDSEFNDFGKDRREDRFVVGQIWAVYDTLDAMPRFYARINRIISTSPLKMRITWLDPDPDDEDEIKWVEAGLPVSCGELTKGNTETTDKRLMFSHLVDWKKGSKKETCKIYPRTGEIWALFRNWDINWHSDPETKMKYEFEFVEILSDYYEDNGVSVAYLGKVKGFSCLFCRTGREGADSFQIPRNQLFRFSHRVPSFHLSGKEREGVPKNSFELDPASLPPKIEEIDIPKDPKVEVETIVISEGDSPGHEVENEMELDSEGNSEERLEACEVPEPEFFNFDGEKSPEKFKSGQFWALYSDEDGLPKYYAFIKKVIHRPQFKLLVTWLSPCPTKYAIKNADKRVPVVCGIFKHSNGETSSYTDTRTFSHCLRVEPTNKKHEYAIYPRKGEVWGVYKNWNSRMILSDLEQCEYDLVEILEENDFVIKVLVLERVSGYKSVFKARRINGALVVDPILRLQLRRFSHQIPAFRLTGEKGGSGLKGYWELDPAALPVKMLHSS